MYKSTTLATVILSAMSFNCFAFSNTFLVGDKPEQVAVYGYKLGDTVEAIKNKSLKDAKTGTTYSLDPRFQVALVASLKDQCIERYNLFNGYGRDDIVNAAYDLYADKNINVKNGLVDGLITAYRVNNKGLNGETLTLWLDSDGKIQAIRSDGHIYDNASPYILRDVVANRFGVPDEEWRIKDSSRVMSFTDDYRPVPSADVDSYFIGGDYILDNVSKAKQYNYKSLQAEYVANFFATPGRSIDKRYQSSKDTNLTVFLMNDPDSIQDNYVEKYDECYDSLPKMEKLNREMNKNAASKMKL